MHGHTRTLHAGSCVPVSHFTTGSGWEGPRWTGQSGVDQRFKEATKGRGGGPGGLAGRGAGPACPGEKVASGQRAPPQGVPGSSSTAHSHQGSSWGRLHTRLGVSPKAALATPQQEWQPQSPQWCSEISGVRPTGRNQQPLWLLPSPTHTGCWEGLAQGLLNPAKRLPWDLADPSTLCLSFPICQRSQQGPPGVQP